MKSSLPEIKPLATMEAAWAEFDRKRAERACLLAEYVRLRAEKTGDRLRAEMERLGAESDYLLAGGNLVVVITAQVLYGRDVQIDWITRTARPYKAEEKP